MSSRGRVCIVALTLVSSAVVTGCDNAPEIKGSSSGGVPTASGGSSAGGSPNGGADASAGGTLGKTDAGTVGLEDDSGVPSDVVQNGYVAVGPWKGSGFTATDPGAAVITPSCDSSSCTPAFAGSHFCMHGTVTGRTDYTGFAMLGWNVNQDANGAAAQTWNVPDSGGIIITVSNPGNTPLRLQLQGTNPHSGADRWCAALTSGTLMPWSAFVTNCWPGGSPQDPLTAGTPIQQAAVIVPGELSDLPFDLCLVDIQIE